MSETSRAGLLSRNKSEETSMCIYSNSYGSPIMVTSVNLLNSNPENRAGASREANLETSAFLFRG